ncbi:MAG: hypothetical protein LBF26_03805 [Puniceicoccales bacterium]|nr:hypothetical protein [Puniceicoccales bacterium]
MIVWEEVQKFCASVGVPEPTLGENNVAVVEFENVGELVIDVSEKDSIYMYLFSDRPRLTAKEVLRTLQSCDPSRLTGKVPLHFIADDKGRVGFLAVLPANDCYAAAIINAFNQVLQLLLRLIQL